jgi:hypothetical protein
MSQKHFTPTPEKRGLLERLSLVGWIIIITVSALMILLAVAAVNWAAPRMPDLPLFGRATPTSVLPTSTPRPTATPLPTATATPTSTVNVPATWSAGMWQDANGRWWPADDVREDVIGMVKQHYLEIYENVWNLTYDEIYDTLSEEEVSRYLTGQHLEDHRLSRKRYRDTGTLPSERYMIVTERKLTIRDFASNGQSCTVADMYRAAHLLKYDPDTDGWNKVEIPEDGLLDGTQYLGTALYRMDYDPEDGRWKQSELVDWLPRP